MSQTISIGDRPVGEDHPTFIIAEVGKNHKGSIERAKELIWEAAGAGADAVKFQSYRAETLVTRDAPRYWDEDEPTGTQFAVFKETDSFGEEDFVVLHRECERAGIVFLSTPFDLEYVDFLNDIGMAAFKVASADLTNLPLLIRVAEKGRPVVLSTGAATEQEVIDAVKTVQSVGNEQIVLLHCVLSYPTPLDAANLKRIPALAASFPNCVIGWSDHVIAAPTAPVPSAAVAVGARVVEKHFTLRTAWPGDDHYHSVDPAGLAVMVENIRAVEKALGTGDIRFSDIEEEARKYARRSIVAVRDIPAGSTIGREQLIMKRPGTGISPTEIESVIGSVAKVDIAEDSVLQWDMFP